MIKTKVKQHKNKKEDMEKTQIFERIYSALETLENSFLNCGCVEERHGIMLAVKEIEKIEKEM